MGDPAGIGPDIILLANARATGPTPPVVVFADPEILNERAQALGIDVNIHVIDTQSSDPADAPPASLAVAPLTCPQTVVAGTPDQKNGPAVIASIERATQAVVNGTCAALVTAPISKATVYESGFAYPGHTEFLAALASRHYTPHTYTSVMMIASDVLRVVPLTIHIPLASVPSAINSELLTTTITIVHDALRQDFAIATPRIAVAGLNPHAGEAGTLGREEQKIITPILETMRRKGFAISGPHSADTLFHEAARRSYDAVIAMYHDQALIPIKTLAFDTGVNVTLGLPFVRTSPDHGTAFDIAATGRANPSSYTAALNMAHHLATNRKAAAKQM